MPLFLELVALFECFCIELATVAAILLSPFERQFGGLHPFVGQARVLRTDCHADRGGTLDLGIGHGKGLAEGGDQAVGDHGSTTAHG